LSDTIQILGTTLFALAVLHTFSIKVFQHLALKFPEGSVQENLFHLLGEVEIVFGLWAGLLVAGIALLSSGQQAIQYVEGANFTEPVFVFAIMSVAATRPVLDFGSGLIGRIARLMPLPREGGFYFAALVMGPLLGSFITEPAAMTVTALILRDRFFSQPLSDRFRYATLGILFVNVSIGGVLTPFAAPPVLMVAGTWNWNVAYMMQHFGLKAVVATLLNAGLGTAAFYRELQALQPHNKASSGLISPLWLRGLHLLFLGLIVLLAHHPRMFMGVFLFFLGLTAITPEFQERLKLKESLLVAFFLGGLVVLGGLQRWWLEPLIRHLDTLPLFLGTTVLTAFTDNATLTYLGSQIPQVSEAFKYALVAGAVAGGGLTVIANAPNPAGFSILRESFGPEGISPAGLAAGAAVPTLIAMACLWWLPSL
jgi:Putative Na+/H+ antiporter